LELIHGECLEEIDALIAKGMKVDLILCDLPYGSTSCGWDVAISLPDLWERYRKIIKPNKPIVLFGSQPFTSVLIGSNLPAFREELVWLKNRGASGLQSSQKHIKVHENICVFSFDSSYTYNPQKWLVDQKEFVTQRRTFSDSEYSGNQIYAPAPKKRKPDTGVRNPLSVVSCRVPFTPQSRIRQYGDDVDLRLHPTQKPLRLCEYLIETFSNPGDTVLDNCMGSGTTGAACRKLGRAFIGIELDDGFFEVAKGRLMDHLQKTG